MSGNNQIQAATISPLPLREASEKAVSALACLLEHGKNAPWQAWEKALNANTSLRQSLAVIDSGRHDAPDDVEVTYLIWSFQGHGSWTDATKEQYDRAKPDDRMAVVSLEDYLSKEKRTHPAPAAPQADELRAKGWVRFDCPVCGSDGAVAERPQAAALLAADSKAGGEVVALDLTLSKDEAEYIAAFISDDNENDDEVVRLMLGGGHSGYGLYACHPEYLEEGAILVKNTHPQQQAAQAADSKAGGEVVDLVLYCPKCHAQHIDAPEIGKFIETPQGSMQRLHDWNNPPHKSHLCHGCGHIWRPSDTPTNGVERTASGKDADTHPQPAQVAQPLTEDVATLRAVSDEYNSWIRFNAAGGSYDDFLKSIGIGKDQA